MDKYGIFTAPDTIRFERLLPGPIENVWAYLTESDKRGKWLASGELEPFVGGQIELNFYHANLTTEEETIPEKYKKYEKGSTSIGRVTQYDPPHKLAYTWEDTSDQASEVSFELKKQEDKVLLILIHTRLDRDRENLLGVASGWHTHLGILKNQVEGKVSKGFWTSIMQLQTEYSKLIKN